MSTGSLALVDGDRAANLLQCLDSLKGLNGMVIEFGVYKGGSLYNMATHEPNRHFIGIDTFTGLPEKTEGIDQHAKGDFSDTSFESVQNALSALSNVTVLKGVFPDDFVDLDLALPLVMAHVDVDMYESTKRCLEFSAHHLVSGGLIICDDYSCDSTRGAKKAVHEFLATHWQEFEVIRVVYCQITIKRRGAL